MRLDDAALERYSRQIILPQIGGRGQERLLATRVGVVGEGDAVDVALDLLARAGLPTGPVSTANVLVDLSPGGRVARETYAVTRPAILGRVSDVAACVTTVVGRPCARCVADDEPIAHDGTLAALVPAAAGALGALAALEALRVVMLRPAAGRRTLIDLGTGVFDATPLPSTRGCRACGAPA